MEVYEVKDVVREHFGRLGLPTNILDIALAEGRKLIEKEENFWWMESETTFNLTIDQQTYVIAASGGDITIPNFKDAQALHWKRSTDVRWEPVALGQQSKDDLDVFYDTDDEGFPEAAALKDLTIYVYPPKPNAAYNMKLFHYSYTTNPAGNTSTADELFRNWGMALVYGALIWGYEIYLKDFQGAEYWRMLLGGKPFGRGGELLKLKRLNFRRGWRSMVNFEPRLGPGSLTNRSIDNLKIYVRS